jgi:hypothetical protein
MNQNEQKNFFTHKKTLNFLIKLKLKIRYTLNSSKCETINDNQCSQPFLIESPFV